MTTKENSSKQYQNAVIYASTEDTADGLKIRAKLKSWGTTNLNGYNFAKNSYDDFIADYYEKFDYKLPLTLMHGHSFADIVGEVTLLDNREDGLYCEAVIFADYPQFGWLEKLVKSRILGGVSDDGFLLDYSEDAATGAILVEKAQIMNVSIVTTPAEPLAKVEEMANTAFRGFSARKKTLKFLRNSKNNSICKRN